MEMRVGNTEPSSLPWISSFDGLRTLAAAAVIIHHTNAKAFSNWALGNLGVSAFFCLSGFLAYYILHNDEKRLGKISYNYYLSRRVLRIWPAYFVLIAVAFYAAGDNYSRAHTYILQLFTFTMN
jgi:peptidoglycan/LPS O-acetylase OafA/YrhL